MSALPFHDVANIFPLLDFRTGGNANRLRSAMPASASRYASGAIPMAG